MKMSNQRKIGIFVVIVLGLLALITLRAVNFSFIPHGYQLKILFKDIDGIEENAPVTVNGFEVGRVTQIRILYGEATRVELTLWLEEKARIHKGAKAFVKNMGFMGEKYIALTTGDDGAPFLEPGTVVEGETPADLQKIFSEGQQIAENLKDISAQIKERLRVNAQSVDDTLHNLASISKNIDERLEVNKDHIDAMAGHLSIASQNLEELSCDLKANPWKLLYRPKKNPCPKLK